MTYLHLYRQKPFRALERSKRKLKDKLMTEPTEIRFGIVAVEKGFIKSVQVINALRMQVKENSLEGKHRHIGQILLDQQSQIGEVLKNLY
jgi:hypothetical protein